MLMLPIDASGEAGLPSNDQVRSPLLLVLANGAPLAGVISGQVTSTATTPAMAST